VLVRADVRVRLRRGPGEGRFMRAQPGGCAGRVDNVYGDRNVMCSCVPMSAYAEDAAH
jgi:hypothetical protein